MITAVTVLSESKAYCFNCLTKLFGKSHVVLTFIDSLIDLRCDNNTILCSAIYTVIQKDLILPYCCIYGMSEYGDYSDVFLENVRPLAHELGGEHAI